MHQTYCNRGLHAAALFSPDDLRLPVMLCRRKKAYAQNATGMQDLEKAADSLCAGKCHEARGVLQAVDQGG
jgi:hypothetical protein